MKTKHFIWLVLSMSFLSLTAQISYEDVAVIINENDNNSVEIGQYFAQKRNIPQNNLVYIQCPSVELIDSAGFANIREQIENKLTSQGIANKINYLVTTKGIPFNVRKSESCSGLDGVKYCSSLDSELSLIFSEWSGLILNSGFVSNPFFNKDEYFDRSKYGFLLVTRLDAYTVDDVKNLIDRSGPGVEVAKNSSQLIFDFSYVTDPAIKDLFTDFIQPTVNYLILNDWNVIFNPSDELLTGQSDVLGYYNINYQPSNKVLDFDWLDGSISEILLSTGNLTFYKEQNVFNELSVPDLIEEGVTGSCTYANNTYFSMVIQPQVLYARYLNDGLQPSYNLAESYYMAMPQLSNQYLVIGDPKTSLNIQQSNTGELDNQSGLILFPNPAADMLHMSFSAEIQGDYKVFVRDITGKTLLRETRHFNKGIVHIDTDISILPDGIYMVNLFGPGDFNKSLKFIRTGKR